MLGQGSSQDKAGSDDRKGSFLQSAVNKSGMNKEQILMNQELIKPRIDFVDMETQKVQFAIESALLAIGLAQRGELKYFKDIAQKLKQEFDEKFKGCWHVVVGKNFGSYISYESKNMIQFWMKDVGFMIYKFG